MASAEVNANTVPEHCPGTKSEEAGKASACAGCPNQQICSTGATKAEDPRIKQVIERLKNVKHTVLILSGKGGVGKSTISTLLSRGLAAQDRNKNVGVLDLDICGPSQPRMLGVGDEQVHQSGSGWSPVYVEDNLSVMSIGFLLASPDDAVIWRGPKKNGMIGQFLSEVDWEQLEYLIIDFPPGTSDEHLSAISYLKPAGLLGAVIVTTPQECSMLDVRKEIDFCRRLDVKVLGVVENMAVFNCPKCKKSSDIFPADSGGPKAMCKEKNILFLGSMPLDSIIAKSCDEGVDVVAKYPESQVAKLVGEFVSKLTQQCEGYEA